MITLYHSPKTRATSIVWLLEEIDLAYDLRRVTIRRSNPGADGSDFVSKRDPANVHPHGKVPAIVHDGVMVHESAAIALYLTDGFPDAGLGPQVGDPLRGAYLSWLAYEPGVFEPSLTAAFFKLDVPASTVAWSPIDEVMAHINKTLSQGPYLLGDTFSAVDVLFGGGLALFIGSALIANEEPIASYVERLTTRPAYLRAAAIDAESEG